MGELKKAQDERQKLLVETEKIPAANAVALKKLEEDWKVTQQRADKALSIAMDYQRATEALIAENRELEEREVLERTTREREAHQRAIKEREVRERETREREHDARKQLQEFTIEQELRECEVRENEVSEREVASRVLGDVAESSMDCNEIVNSAG